MSEARISSNPEFRRDQFLRQSGVFFVMLCYPVLSMFWRTNYPIQSLEFILFLLCITATALLVGALASLSRQWLADSIIALCMILVLILQFNLLFEGAAVLLLGVVTLALVLRGKLGLMGLIVFPALIIGAYVDSRLDHARNSAHIASANQEAPQPTVVHILLDGFIGVNGLPPQNAPQALREKELEFFAGNGFDIYSQAYSHYPTTQDSLSHIFNFTNDGETPALSAATFHTNLAVRKNRYFELLHNQGYSISVYQSDLVEFCQAVPNAIGRCLTYNTPNLKSVRTLVPNPWLRLRILTNHLFKQSNLLYTYLSQRGWLSNWGVAYYQPNVIDEIGDDMERLRGGVFFAHLLIPHEPFVFRNDCEIDYTSESWERGTSAGLISNTLETRAARYLRYLPQAECALKEMERLFDRMRQLDLYDQSIIVLHGDHGSRISLHTAHRDNRNEMTSEDYRDLYSTLFAIKHPGGVFREHTETVSLNALMSQTVADITGHDRSELGPGLAAEATPFFYLSGQFPLLRQDIDVFDVP